jgi:hypothetical protein
MLFRRAFPVLVLAAGAASGSSQAQSISGQGLSLFKLTPEGRTPWRLLLSAAPGKWPDLSETDAGFTRLVLSGLEVRWLQKEPWQRFLSDSGPDLDPKIIRWALLDSALKIQASGSGLPDSATVESSLRKELGALPWDTLDAVLRVEPMHGEARLALAEWALAWAAPDLFRNPEAIASLQSRRFINERAGSDEALKKLLAVPDWPSQLDLGGGGAGGQFGSLLKRGASAERLEEMGKQVLEELRSDPARDRLQSNLAFLLLNLAPDTAERLVGDMEEIEPLPGQVWPPLSIIHASVEVFRRQSRWTEIRERMAAWSRPEDPLFLTPAKWDQRIIREATLQAYGLQAESWLDGWDSLPPSLNTLRGMAGNNYHGMAKLLLARANIPAEDIEFRKKIAALVARPALAPPAMPSPTPPWRVKVRDKADLARLREAFDTRMALLPWLLSERFLELSPNLETSIALFLGNERIEPGPGLPVPETLADTLRAHRAGRLFEVWERASKQPEAPGPRQQRIDLLLERMPVRALESVLALDLSKESRGADLLDWDLDENLWFVQSQHAIPGVEDHLHHWPLDSERWVALAFWTSFIPNHPGPISLAEQMPSWKAGLSVQLCLPAKIHGELAEEFKRRRGWNQMRRWFEPAWLELHNLKPGDARRKALMDELGSALVSSLEHCYLKLGRTGDRKNLVEEWDRARAKHH